MNILIITSSYPACPGDPEGTAGLFVREFALELSRQGHQVVVSPVARKASYQPDPGLIVEPLPWNGGDQELASMDFYRPKNWLTFWQFFRDGRRRVAEIAQRYKIQRVLCMWVVPSGVFGLHLKKKFGIPYDLWALGSDIWKIRKIPFLGSWFIRVLARRAGNVYADGVGLCRDVRQITGVACYFLPSSRRLPAPQPEFVLPGKGKRHFLFVGRYHQNKGPDLLIEAVAELPAEIRRAIQVHMFGLGPMEGFLREKIRSLDLEHSVNLGGPIAAQELADYLSRVEFLLIPSRIESIPVIFSDAMHSSVPVIAMPVGDIPDLITQFNCGVAAREVTSQSFCSAIQKGIECGPQIYRSGVERTSDVFKITETVGVWLSKS